MEEAGGGRKAMLLAALLQLGKLLAMHAGGVAAGTWRLLRRRWSGRPGVAEEEARVAVQCSSGLWPVSPVASRPCSDQAKTLF